MRVERRRRAALDQRPEKPFLFEAVPRTQHWHLGRVRETQGDRMFGHKCTTGRKRRAQAMHSVPEIFQQLSLMVGIAS
ncbi:MAG TPA: hypothetical protein VGZ73_17890 [Bryobacteraceae bacterium]|jgi:hypothetical protein|nr:hypothetical protein [Bryobacteraceae bacterium]